MPVASWCPLRVVCCRGVPHSALVAEARATFAAFAADLPRVASMSVLLSTFLSFLEAQTQHWVDQHTRSLHLRASVAMVAHGPGIATHQQPPLGSISATISTRPSVRLRRALAHQARFQAWLAISGTSAGQGSAAVGVGKPWWATELLTHRQGATCRTPFRLPAGRDGKLIDSQAQWMDP